MTDTLPFQMQCLHSRATLVNIQCVLFLLLLIVLLHGHDLDLGVVVGQAHHVPILVLDFVNLAHDSVRCLWVVCEAQVDQVAGVVLVESDFL